MVTVRTKKEDTHVLVVLDIEERIAQKMSTNVRKTHIFV